MLCNSREASGSSEQFRADSIADIARAIMTERERCAQVADDYADNLPASTDFDSRAHAAAEIAAAIRNQGSEK